MQYQKIKKTVWNILDDEGTYKGQIYKTGAYYHAEYEGKTVVGNDMGQGSAFKTLKSIKEAIKETSAYLCQ